MVKQSTKYQNVKNKFARMTERWMDRHAEYIPKVPFRETTWHWD